MYTSSFTCFNPNPKSKFNFYVGYDFSVTVYFPFPQQMDISQINVKLIFGKFDFCFLSHSLKLNFFSSFTEFIWSMGLWSVSFIENVCVPGMILPPPFSTPKWIFIWVDLWLMPRFLLTELCIYKHTRIIGKLYVCRQSNFWIPTQSNAFKSVWCKESGFRYIFFWFFVHHILILFLFLSLSSSLTASLPLSFSLSSSHLFHTWFTLILE